MSLTWCNTRCNITAHHCFTHAHRVYHAAHAYHRDDRGSVSSQMEFVVSTAASCLAVPKETNNHRSSHRETGRESCRGHTEGGSCHGLSHRTTCIIQLCRGRPTRQLLPQLGTLHECIWLISKTMHKRIWPWTLLPHFALYWEFIKIIIMSRPT